MAVGFGARRRAHSGQPARAGLGAAQPQRLDPARQQPARRRHHRRHRDRGRGENDWAVGLVSTLAYGILGLVLYGTVLRGHRRGHAGQALGAMMVAEGRAAPGRDVNGVLPPRGRRGSWPSRHSSEDMTAVETRAPAPARSTRASAACWRGFVCAACGLVYELALVALGSYLSATPSGRRRSSWRHGVLDGRRRAAREAAAARAAAASRRSSWRWPCSAGCRCSGCTPRSPGSTSTRRRSS